MNPADAAAPLAMIPAPVITRPNPDFEREVDRRTVAVCAAHADTGEFDPRCPWMVAHMSEARSQLLDEWQRQDG